MKRCQRCALPITYPGIKLNNDNVCNYCIYYEIHKDRENQIKGKLLKEFTDIIRKSKRQKNKYDCIVAYSGGKDSTFLLNFLKNAFDLRILAHTLDNNFISPTTQGNIKKVIKSLSVDYIVTKPSVSITRKIFNYTLTEKVPYPKEVLSMMSPVCAACQGMIFGSTINLAIKLKIPLMFIGYTPGQYPAISLENFLKVKSCVFLSSEVHKDDPLDIIKIVSDPLFQKFNGEIEPYYFKSQYIKKNEFVPHVLFPYHALIDYDEKNIFDEVSKLGWIKPPETDYCSTNCLLNTLGNYACVKQFRFHPYIGELSCLVREGKLNYQDAIKAETVEHDSFAMLFSLKQLDLDRKEIFVI